MIGYLLTKLIRSEKGDRLRKELIGLIDEDAVAYNRLMEAFKMPRDTEELQRARDEAIELATKGATDIPSLVGKNILQICVSVGNL